MIRNICNIIILIKLCVYFLSINQITYMYTENFSLSN